LWQVASALQVPLDIKVKEISEIPYTISFVIRKRIQIDNLMELPKDKRPTSKLIWNGTTEELEEWLDKVFDRKKKKETHLILSEDDIE
jgi:hypothetical protein